MARHDGARQGLNSVMVIFEWPLRCESAESREARLGMARYGAAWLGVARQGPKGTKIPTVEIPKC